MATNNQGPKNELGEDFPKRKVDVYIEDSNEDLYYIWLWADPEYIDKIEPLGTFHLLSKNKYEMHVDKRYDFDEVLAYIDEGHAFTKYKSGEEFKKAIENMDIKPLFPPFRFNKLGG